MKTTQELNLTISKDDHHSNDFVFCWKEMNTRPSRINLYHHFNPSLFLDFLMSLKPENAGTYSDILPGLDDDIINEKRLMKVKRDIYISYVHYDKKHEDNLITDVSIYYVDSSSEDVNDIISGLENTIVDSDENISEISLSTLIITQNGLEIEPMPLMSADYDNIDSYYNDDVIKKIDKLSKTINKSNKGLSVIYGERGTGKTTLISYLISNLNKSIIFVPSNLIEFALNNPEFNIFLKKYSNSVLVIDDSEIYFGQTHSKSNILSNNLVQFVDGLQSDQFNINIILAMNILESNDVDDSIFECNNLLSVIEVNKLEVEKSKELSKLLKLKNKFKNPVRLIDILKGTNFKNEDKEIGFN